MVTEPDGQLAALERERERLATLLVKDENWRALRQLVSAPETAITLEQRGILEARLESNKIYQAWRKIGEAATILREATVDAGLATPAIYEEGPRAAARVESRALTTTTPEDRARHAAGGNAATASPPEVMEIDAPQPEDQLSHLTPEAAEAAQSLMQLRGMDAETAAALAGQGVQGLAEVAAWTAADVRRLRKTLGLGRRISQNQWIEQAAMLSSGVETAFATAFAQEAETVPVGNASSEEHTHAEATLARPPRIEIAPPGPTLSLPAAEPDHGSARDGEADRERPSAMEPAAQADPPLAAQDDAGTALDPEPPPMVMPRSLVAAVAQAVPANDDAIVEPAQTVEKGATPQSETRQETTAQRLERISEPEPAAAAMFARAPIGGHRRSLLAAIEAAEKASADRSAGRLADRLVTSRPESPRKAPTPPAEWIETARSQFGAPPERDPAAPVFATGRLPDLSGELHTPPRLPPPPTTRRENLAMPKQSRSAEHVATPARGFAEEDRSGVMNAQAYDDDLAFEADVEIVVREAAPASLRGSQADAAPPADEADEEASGTTEESLYRPFQGEIEEAAVEIVHRRTEDTTPDTRWSIPPRGPRPRTMRKND